MSRYQLNSKHIIKTDNDTLIVPLDDMKLYLRIESSETTEDDLITGLILSAQKTIEKYTRRELLNKTFTMYLDFFPYACRLNNRFEEAIDNYTIEVKRSKLDTINHIKYYSNDILETLDSALYDFTQDNDYSRIHLIDSSSTWPDIDNRKQAIEIEFVAGYGDSSDDVPDDLITAIQRLVAYMYENRGDCLISCDKLCELAGVKFILNPYVILEI